MITSFFRKSKLWELEEQMLLKKLRESMSQDIESVKLERRFLVDSSTQLIQSEQEMLAWLLQETFEPNLFSDRPLLNDGVFEVGPRLAIVTPKSTNAVSICHACGLNSITRVEQAMRIVVGTREGAPLTGKQRERVYALIHDRMTEQPYLSPITTFESEVKPAPVRLIPVLEEGIASLRRFNDEYGTAFDEQLMEYICNYYIGIGRNPTDVELFMFGQLNSEHCRHHRFRGIYKIDGNDMPSSLFGLIKATVDTNAGNVISAFKDNAAVLRGSDVLAFMPSDPTKPSPFMTKDVRYCITYKVETHNHPTAISPYPGEETKLGGLIRDIEGVGRGGIVTAAIDGRYVGNLFIPHYLLPWEHEYAQHPPTFATPLEIAIQGSSGAFDYGNRFGIPLVAGVFRTFEQMVDGVHYAYRKPVSVGGCSGIINELHAEKKEPKKGHLVVQIGGDGYRIGLGGGSGSSKDAGGQSAELDFNSVQRGDGEMENRNDEVIVACAEMGAGNPIVTITDLGAGGECVALPEIVEVCGATYGLRKLPVGDKTMPVFIIWCNESQERMVMVVKPDGIETLRKICARNRCPMYVVGEVRDDGRLLLLDEDAPADSPREQREPIDVDMKFLLANLPKMTVTDSRVPRKLKPPKLPDGMTVRNALERVLRLPSVASKDWLTRKVDRTVGGLVARQQRVGPLQITLADCAVIANSFVATSGMAKAIGEQPIKGLVNPAAGARMSIAEALTNLVWARVESFESINFSATWQWPCKQPGEDARLYDAVKAASDLCINLGLRIPVGKDSVSMTAWTKKNGEKWPIRAPGTVQMVAFAPCADITKHVTPDIKKPGKSALAHIDISGGKQRLGGSALAQVFNQIGDESPDIDDPVILRAAFEAVQELIDRGLILAGHDISDGGLITCLLEMAFAGNCGFKLNIKPYIHWNNDVILASLFSEESGFVIEYEPEAEGAVYGTLLKYGIHGYFCNLGMTSENKTIEVKSMRKIAIKSDMLSLRAIWQETSFQLDALQANPECVKFERESFYDSRGMNFNLTFKPEPTKTALLSMAEKPKVAILREEGTNGAREMAGAFFKAGFEPCDVPMADLVEGNTSLDRFRGIAFSGGFSFADVLDAGKGWAGVIKFNEMVRQQFETFLARPDTFSLGVCNGCQVMALLGWVPFQGIKPESQPRFVRNKSGIFESRFLAVRIYKSPSIFLNGMEDSILGVYVAHGEGRCFWPDTSVMDTVLEQNLAPMVFVDENGGYTDRYPFNPNGSELGITALCSPDGRHLALMPHPERLFLRWQWPYWPREWSDITLSPWLRFFQNAREWCETIK